MTMINKKLYSININSLNILDVLLKKKSVTLTGKTLNLSQSAVSINLRNLREIFEDDLLVRSSNRKQLELTPLAKKLQEPLRKIIDDIENMVFNPELQNYNTQRTLKLAITDPAMMTFIPCVLEKLKCIFPKVKLDTCYFSHYDYIKKLKESEIDLAVGAITTETAPNDIYYRLLIKDHHVCVAKKGHPILLNDTISLKEFQSYPRIMIKYVKSPYTITQESTTQNDSASCTGAISNDVLFIHNTSSAFPILLETNRVMLIGTNGYKLMSRYFDIGYTNINFDPSSIDYVICCVKKSKNDKLINTVIELFSEISKMNVCQKEASL